MIQLCCSVAPRFFIIFVVSLFSMCLALPLDEPYYSENLMKNYRLKKYLGALNEIEESYSPDSSPEHYIADLTSGDQRFGTSCGKIICDDVKDYPADSIQRAFSETYKTLLPPPKEADQFILNSRNGFLVPLDEESEETYVSDIDYQNRFKSLEDTSNVAAELTPIRNDAFEKNLQYAATIPDEKDNRYGIRMSRTQGRSTYNVLTKTKRPNCDEQVKNTVAREALNKEKKPVTLLELDVSECIADKFCFDDQTPENHVHKCETKIEKRKWDTYNKVTNKLIKQDILVPNGCYCRLVHV